MYHLNFQWQNDASQSYAIQEGDKIQLTLKLSHNEIYATAMILMSSILTQKFYFWEISFECAVEICCSEEPTPKFERANITQGTHQFLIFHYLLLKRFYIFSSGRSIWTFTHVHPSLMCWFLLGMIMWGKKGFSNIFCEICFQLTHKILPS